VICDSTALSRRLDPEDLRDVIQEYQKVCAESSIVLMDTLRIIR